MLNDSYLRKEINIVMSIVRLLVVMGCFVALQSCTKKAEQAPAEAPAAAPEAAPAPAEGAPAPAPAEAGH